MQRNGVFALVRRLWLRGILGLSVALSCLAVQAQPSPEFTENFGTCTASTLRAPNVGTARGSSPWIFLTLYQPLPTCTTGWTFQGNAFLAESNSGGAPFPGGATKAMWLNEPGEGRPRGSMTRTVSNLVIGQRYEVSAQAWTDDVDAPTALGVKFGDIEASLSMAAGSGVQSIKVSLCALQDTLPLELHENGATASSPIVTNVVLRDLQEPCQFTVTFVSNGGTAVAPQTVAYNDQATTGTTTNGSQAFAGWYTDPSFAQGTLYNFATPVTQDVTLYAQWVPGFSVGGEVIGLNAGSTLQLMNSNGDLLSMTAAGNFVFPSQLADNAAYSVSVSSQPPGQRCEVTRGNGNIPGDNVTNVLVTCRSIYTVSGTLTGLAANASVMLQNNAGDNLTMNADGGFIFSEPLLDGASYVVTVGTQPQGQRCEVTRGTGSINAANVTNVLVTCASTAVVAIIAPVPSLSAWGLIMLSAVLAFVTIVRSSRTRMN
ncbi:IPTL-CTERM sorting domain-containing protein [Ottowia thiooxydans]|uniref:IPTL-CTERM sorting domain-containing protein n=1 Tax=Ottowia thiooxydans TaxID=219182 RepID=UPI000685A31C|nr:IPTL-CTERM sorting domain-containing protein [Ottowia thiooxydans]